MPDGKMKRTSFRVLYRTCEKGMVMGGRVLAEDYEKACFAAAKTFPIVVEVIRPKSYGIQQLKAKWINDFRGK